MVERVSGERKLKRGERVTFNPFEPASQGRVVKEADVEKKFQADKKARLAREKEGGTLNSGALKIGRGINSVLGINPPGENRTQAPTYYMPDKKPTPSTPGPGPRGPRTRTPKAPAVTAKKSVVATPQRAAARTTIANVNSSDRATGNAYSSGYGSSRQAGGWGAGKVPKKGVGVSTKGSFGKSIKGLKWFNGKD